MSEKTANKAEPVAYRVEHRPGRYSFMEPKHFAYNKLHWAGARVHALILGPLVHEPGMDEAVALMFPSFVEQRMAEEAIERERFELWAVADTPFGTQRQTDGFYVSSWLQNAWNAWQARAAIATR